MNTNLIAKEPIMLKFVLETESSPRPVTPNEWGISDMADIVLYMTAPHNHTFAVLRRIMPKTDTIPESRYGFVQANKLFYPSVLELVSRDTHTNFTAPSAQEAITKALKSGRVVVGFSNIREALTYVLANLAPL